MRSAKLLFLLAAGLFTGAAHGQTYQLKPVLVQVFAAEQPDTMGFNIARVLPQLFYSHVLDGTLPLYDSPLKKLAITPDALKQIEKSNHSSMREVKSIFLHEYWTRRKGKLEIFPMGVTLSDFDAAGNIISYGYIDLEEAFEILSDEPVEANANGCWPFTCWQALKSRRFICHLVQFGKKVFHDRELAEQVLHKNMNGAVLADRPELADKKLVTFTIDANVQHKRNTELVNKLEKLLRTNPELRDSCTFPAKITDPNKDIHITRIQVKEVWTRSGGFFEYTPLSFIAYNNDSALREISFHEFLFTDFKLFENDISSKYYELTIDAINSQAIRPQESLKYLNALRAGIRWTQLSPYVKTN